MLETDKNTKKFIKIINNINISDIEKIKSMSEINKSQYKLFKTDQKNPKRLIMYFYGSGYFLPPSKKLYESCRSLADKLYSDIMLICYPLAPEHKFPENIIKTKSLLDSIIKKELINYNDVYLLGESSGGNLITSILMTDYKLPKCSGLILLYPSLDYYKQDYPSKIKYTNYGLNIKIRNFYSKIYLHPTQDKKNPSLSPIYNNNFNNFPKILLNIAKLDPLRDESVLFSELLLQNKIKTNVYMHNTIHNFFSLKIEPYYTNTINSINEFID